MGSTLKSDALIWKAYCTTEDVRRITFLSTSDVSDVDMRRIIEFACQQLNADLNKYHYKELVEYINGIKDNDIDNSNTIFYTKDFPIGDYNDDFTVNTSDVKAYTVSGDTTETEVTVSALDGETGKVTLTTAPNNVDLYFTYNSIQRQTTDPIIRRAAATLAAAMCFSKIIIGKATRFKLGNMTVFRDTDAYNKLYNQYRQLLSEVNNRVMIGIIEGENLI